VPTAAVAERVLRRQLMFADQWLAVHFRRRDIAAAGGASDDCDGDDGGGRLRRRTTTTASQRRLRRRDGPPVGLDAKTTTVAVLAQATAARLL